MLRREATRPERAHYWWWAGGVNLLAAITVFGASALLDAHDLNSIAQLLWPTTGLGLAWLIVFGPIVIPGLVLGTTLIQLHIGVSLPVSLMYGSLETAALLFTRTLLVGGAGFRPGFERIRDLIAFLGLGVVLGPLVGAALWAVAFCTFGQASWSFYLPSLKITWFVHAAGALVFAPPILCWTRRPRWLTPPRLLEFGCLIAGVVATSIFAWHDPWKWTDNTISLAFVPLVFGIWAALRFGPPGAALVSLLAVLLAAWATSDGTGAFARANLHQATHLLFAFIAVAICTPLLAASLLCERDRAERERRRLERRLEQTKKLESLGLLAGGVAHDFNNLLTPILGGISLLRRGAASPSRQEEMLDNMKRASDQAKGLCKQMLAFSGRAGLDRRVVDLTQITEDLQHLLDESTGEEISVTVGSESDLPAVEIDVVQIQQVLLNLTRNAADAMQGHRGSLRLRLYACYGDRKSLGHTIFGEDIETGEYVALEVTDEGRGIAEEHVARIFDPFFSTKGAGRGLGLAATLGVVRAHGGTIHVRSGAGTGTTVTLWLPAASDPAPPPSDPNPRARPTFHGG